MKESFDQHDGHRPRPSTGSRQAGQSGGRARSSAVRNMPRTAPAARLIGTGKAMLNDSGMGSGYRRAAAMSSPQGCEPCGQSRGQAT